MHLGPSFRRWRRRDISSAMKAWRAFYGLPARHSITFPNVAAPPGFLACREATPPWAALRESDMRLISLSQLRDDELRGAKHLGLPAPFIPLLPEFVAVQLDMGEHHPDARQLGFSRRQFGR